MTTATVALTPPAAVPASPAMRLYPRRVWASILAVYGILVVAVPALHLLVPAGSVLHLSDYTVTLVGKILCYATVALAMDLVWGYAGILSLCHGLFFALGGYAMGMYLMRAIGRDGVYGDPVLPDFMVFLDWKELPWFWLGSDRFLQQALLVVLVPALLAFVFGWFAFRSRIRGVYFSIITQALTYAAMLLFFRNQTGFGGNNGFTDFKRILGFPLASARTRVVLLVLSATLLLGVLVLCRALVLSKLGRVLTAIRDAEDRVRFCGYDPRPSSSSSGRSRRPSAASPARCTCRRWASSTRARCPPPTRWRSPSPWPRRAGYAARTHPGRGAASTAPKSVLTVAFPELWLFVLGLPSSW